MSRKRSTLSQFSQLKNHQDPDHCSVYRKGQAALDAAPALSLPPPLSPQAPNIRCVSNLFLSALSLLGSGGLLPGLFLSNTGSPPSPSPPPLVFRLVCLCSYTIIGESQQPASFEIYHGDQVLLLPHRFVLHRRRRR